MHQEAGRRHRVLFLCTGNSARSIIAEALLALRASERFEAHSAGSHPTGVVHPHAIDLIAQFGGATRELRSKSWAEYAAPGAPELDFVFTVCDAAAGEACPVWPGQPLTAHWGVADPAAVKGGEALQRRAFFDASQLLERRIALFTSLPLQALDRLVLHRRLVEIGMS